MIKDCKDCRHYSELCETWGCTFCLDRSNWKLKGFIKLKGIIEEDFVNFKQPAMLLMFPFCNFKCDKENQNQFCQNDKLISQPDIEIMTEKLIERYLLNPITSAFIFSGLEPFDSQHDLFDLVIAIRKHTTDPIIIYTGYTEEEIKQSNSWALEEKNIIIKYGRFRPNQESHFDEVLGVDLVSDNQYAKFYK